MDPTNTGWDKFTMRNRLAPAAAMVSLAVFSAPAGAGQKWDMPMAYPASNFHTVNAVAFGECVKAGTAGEIEIATHPNGTLFKGNDIKRAVQQGQVMIGERLLSAHENENALFGLDSVPFVTNSYEQSEKLWQAGRAEISKALEDQGLVMLYSVPWPPQGIYFKKDVNSTDDMKGVKVRSYNNSTGKISELSGMVPVQLEASEITQGLITGVIESLITSAVTGQDSKAWEQLTHFYKVNAWQPRNFVLANKDAWDGLSEATRKVFTDCAATAEANGVKMSIAANDKALTTLAEKGMKVLDPSDKLAGQLRAIGETMVGGWKTKAGAAGQAVLEAYAK
jgi:TRAP-type C4-dicarboxylate transport system substrate-binding protein